MIKEHTQRRTQQTDRRRTSTLPTCVKQ